MENPLARHKLKKRDGIFLGLIFLVALIFLVWFYVGHQKPGLEVEVTIDGVVYGVYSLAESQEIPILIDGETTNVLMISEGVADVTKAHCPDKLCVHQKEVSKAGESIVCLPNKVVVTIIGERTTELDTVVQ